MQEKKLHLEDVPQLLVTLLEKIERLEMAIQGFSPQASDTLANNDLMSIDEAAAFLRLTKNTLYKKVSKSEIPNSKHGKKLYFRKSELEQCIASGRRKTDTELSAQADEYLANRYVQAKKTRKP